MCAACQAEYDDPADRRFHAQPNACPRAGRVLAARREWRDAAPRSPDAVAAAADAVAAPPRAASGAIVAVKGVGGYHLACRADDEASSRGCGRASTARTGRSR